MYVYVYVYVYMYVYMYVYVTLAMRYTTMYPNFDSQTPSNHYQTVMTWMMMACDECECV